MPKDPNDLFEQFGISPTEGNLALDTDPDDLFQAFGISPEAEQPTVAPEPTEEPSPEVVPEVKPQKAGLGRSMTEPYRRIGALAGAEVSAGLAHFSQNLDAMATWV
jgi:hypothetical protein